MDAFGSHVALRRNLGLCAVEVHPDQHSKLVCHEKFSALSWVPRRCGAPDNNRRTVIHATLLPVRLEVHTRSGIDTRDVGTDAAYLESGIETISAEQARRAAVAEHRKGMALIAAAQAEELHAKAQRLAPEKERHQVPLEYLNNPALSAALQSTHDATTPAAIEAADNAVKERLYLIGNDGIHGPTINQLREATTANFAGAAMTT